MKAGVPINKGRPVEEEFGKGGEKRQREEEEERVIFIGVVLFILLGFGFGLVEFLVGCVFWFEVLEIFSFVVS